MADPFVAEIRLFGFNFPPVGWASCDGQTLPISQNTALFSLLGTTYGGDGKTTFALPNLNGRVPMFYGQGPGLSLHDIGESGGSDTVVLQATELPVHSHALRVAAAADRANAAGNALASTVDNIYSTAGVNTSTSASSSTLAGGNQPHNNLQPYLVMNFCIALQGIFPPRS
jgi:microcystin-dependent protein